MTSIGKPIPVREAALALLNKTLLKSGYSNFVFESFVNKNPELIEKDKALIKALFYGVLRRLYLLDRLTADKCRPPYEKLPDVIKMILRIGLYQLLFMERVPAHAAVFESVELAKKYGHGGTASLVNGVLRSFARQRRVINETLEIAEKNSPEEVASITSHPEWLVKKYIKDFGRGTAADILENNNLIPSQNFRVKSRAMFNKIVEKYALEPKQNRFNKLGVEIDAPSKKIQELFRKGIIAPQDQSSLIAVSLMEGADGRVLELCCGRGNKSEPLIEYVNGTATIVNADVSQKKLSGISGNKRLNPVCLDALLPLPFREKFRYVFLDAPCSNLGAVRRHPEIRYRKSEKEISKSSKAQLRMLENGAGVLADGGRLIYAVCSFEPEETVLNVERFLESNPRFSLCDIGSIRDDLREAGLTHGKFLRIFPGSFGMDGFFAACFVLDS
ncbi:MAG: ribosomal RNA small subunit methyltransferase B [bacterium]|nr:MAG: ribosomal RNA small subunit methyltransferase B [bacterium]